jgi:hypothetical protein
MNTSKGNTGSIWSTPRRLLAAALILGSVGVQAAPIVLTFEGLGNNESIGNFYNGGLGGNGSGPGPNYGVTFSDNALASIDSDAGGTGNFGGEPSPSTTMYFLSGTAAVMNYAAGFDTGFSLFYSAISQAGLVSVYDGIGATGALLASLALPLTPSNGAPDPNGLFSPLVPVGITFNGIARSVLFGGVQDQIGFDNITLGSMTPCVGSSCAVPEPAPVGLLALACGALAVASWRRQAPKDRSHDAARKTQRRPE